ncbi:MAG: hypothetical protein K1X91_15065 [Bacteriodetes bacterium]|nr:hypothetical protein [Bacteroidota bacterium]
MIKIFVIENTRVCVKPITKWATEYSILYTSGLFVTPDGARCFYQVVQKGTRLFVYRETYIDTFFATVSTRKELLEETGLLPASYLELNHLVRSGEHVDLLKSEYDQTPAFDFYQQDGDNEYSQIPPTQQEYTQPYYADDYNTLYPNDSMWYLE